MAAAPRLKLADKQEIYKKVLSSLKKRYPSVPKPPELPVLETMLFAVCLENASIQDAETAYQRLQSNFHDLNEVRVSSIEELEAVFHGMSTPDWRAMRIRGILGHVFESTYSFEFDALKRKTLELATKQLAKIKELTPFVRDFTLHASLGAHVIPLDDVLFHAVEFLDLHAETGGLEPTAESLKPLVRKAEGTEFSGLLREFAVDPKLRPTIELIRQAAVDGAILPASLIRFDKVLKGEVIKFDPPPKKTPEKKSAERAEKKELERKETEKRDLEKRELELQEAEKKQKHSTKMTSGKKSEVAPLASPKIESPKPTPAKTEKSKSEPAKAEPPKAEKTKTEKPKSEAGKTDRAVEKVIEKTAEKTKVELTKTGSTKTEASKTKATSAGKPAEAPAKLVSTKSEPHKTEQLAVETGKATSTKSSAAGKLAPAKTEGKSETKADHAKHDKVAKTEKAVEKSSAALKSDKQESAKPESKKPTPQVVVKSEQLKTKAPAAVAKKEAATAKPDIASSKESTKAAEKSVSTSAKVSSKSLAKPAIEATIEPRAGKKSATKSGK